jgi:RNA polymerase sigma factor (sigma-70 family)
MAETMEAVGVPDVGEFVTRVSTALARKFGMDPEDTVQDCWVLFLKQKPKIQFDVVGVRTYLYLFLRSSVLNLHRRRWPPTEELDAEMLDVDWKDNFDSMDYLRVQQNIDVLLKTLTVREYEILRLFFGVDCDPYRKADIGRRYDLSRERVRQIISEALSKLRDPEHRDLLNKCM